MKKLLFTFFVIFCVAGASAQDSTLQQYVGRYLFADGSVVPSADIEIKDGKLVVNSIQGSSFLEKAGRDTFALISFEGMAYFKRNAAGKVAGVRVEVSDIILEGTKEGVTALVPRRVPAAVVTRQMITK